jgi:hypothetical protein
MSTLLGGKRVAQATWPTGYADFMDGAAFAQIGSCSRKRSAAVLPACLLLLLHGQCSIEAGLEIIFGIDRLDPRALGVEVGLHRSHEGDEPRILTDRIPAGVRDQAVITAPVRIDGLPEMIQRAVPVAEQQGVVRILEQVVTALQAAIRLLLPEVLGKRLQQRRRLVQRAGLLIRPGQAMSRIASTRSVTWTPASMSRRVAPRMSEARLCGGRLTRASWRSASVTARSRYIDSMRDTFEPEYRVPSMTYLDLFASYDFGPGFFEGLRLGFGIENVTDRDPPVFPSTFAANTDPQQYDVLGRRYFATLNYRF